MNETRQKSSSTKVSTEEEENVLESLIFGTGGGLGHYIGRKESKSEHRKCFHQNQKPESGHLGYGRVVFTGVSNDHLPRPYVRVPFKSSDGLKVLDIAKISGQVLLQFAEHVWKLKRPKILISEILICAQLIIRYKSWLAQQVSREELWTSLPPSN